MSPRSRAPLPARAVRALWRHADVPPIEWLTGPVDVVHGPNFVVPPARNAARLATVHDLTAVRFAELVTSDVGRYPALIRRAVAGGAHVHTVSQYVADEVIDTFAIPPDRVHVVPNGVPPVAGGVAARGLAMAGGGPYVLALGTIEPRKDLPSLVQAFDAVAACEPELRLVIAGPDGWGTAELARAIDGAAHRSRIVRRGWVAPGERADLLAGATVFAYPSRYEGFGIPPLEAMTAGVPVVTTRAGALPETVGDAALLVDAGDVDALGSAIAAVLHDTTRRAGLVARGRVRAARFSWRATADGLAAVYGEMAASR